MRSRPRILVTNDDGIYAPGLAVLERIAGMLSDDVWVVAPETEQSGASHSLTLADPLRLRAVEERRIAVKGTPTDCVMMAVKSIMPEPPELVLSGVNRGQNMCEDVTYSGTIAAAMEGTVFDIPSIALSQSYGIRGKTDVPWHTAEHHAPALIRKLIARDWGNGILMNVNFPDCEPDEVKGVEVTVQGERDQNMLRIHERVDARGRPYYWLGYGRRRSLPAEGTDLKAVYDGKISVTPLHMDLTQMQALPLVKELLDS